jgi:hypothetical protein
MIQTRILADLIDGNFQAFMQDLAGALPGAVTGPMKLGEYLETVLHRPRWDRELIIFRRIIKVSRVQNGQQLTFVPTANDFPLVDGDRVDIIINPDYTSDRGKLAAKDYGFVPIPNQGDAFLGFSRDVMALAGVVELTKSDPTRTITFTFEQFADELMNDELVTGPVRNAIVYTHASWSGQLLFSADFGGEAISYEKIDQMAAGGTLHVPDEAFQKVNPGDPKPFIVFGGCEFGQATAFLKKLRETINPNVRVYAPKYWLGVGREDDSKDRYQFMGQRNFIRSKDPLNGAQILSRFHALHIKDRNGNSLPNDLWDTGWPNIPIQPGSFVRAWAPHGIKFPAVNGSGGALPEHTITTNLVTLWCFHADFQLDLATTVSKGAFDQNAVQALVNTVTARAPNAEDALTDAHPFPFYRRFRFIPTEGSAAAIKKAQTDWINSLKWDLTYADRGGGTGRISGIGRSFLYELVTPIVNNKTLLINYYADGAQNNPVVGDLTLDQTDFWGSDG